jgi:glucose/arabinose dehydrogenase
MKKQLNLSSDILHQGEGGLLGFALAPDFEDSSLAFAYHTYRQDGNVYNRVVQIKETESGWEEIMSLLEGIPGNSIHNGGRMKIGPDGKLYITTGDASSPELAQDVNSLALHQV